MRKAILFFAIVGLSVFIGSCDKKNNDITRPVIETFDVYGLNPQVGGNINLGSLISDEQGLSSYKVTVYNDFGYTADTIEDTERLSFTNVVSFDQLITTHLVNQRVNFLANNSAGPYKISLEVVDNGGNESAKRTKSFELLNPSDQPQVTLNFPTEDTIFSGTDTLAIQGILTDNAVVKKATFALSNKDGYSYSTTVDSIYTASWDIANDGVIKLPFSSNTGMFDLTINVQDTSGNMKRVTTSFTKN